MPVQVDEGGGNDSSDLHPVFTIIVLLSRQMMGWDAGMNDRCDRRGLAGLLPQPCPSSCPSARLAALAPEAARKRKASYASLIALFVPALGFAVGMIWLRGEPGFAWVFSGHWPWQMWVLALAGTAATVAGMLDWMYHRWMTKCAISKKERQCELIALACGGVPVFGMMMLASVSAKPLTWLLPVLVAVIFTTALICYDEFIFHRKRCQKLETRLHRVLVFGNGIAWLAWAHWCFVERASTLA